MPKKKLTYYHDQLSISPEWMESASSASTNALEQYLRDAADRVTDALNAASSRGEIDALVDGFLSGDTFLTKNTQEARDVYTRLIPDEVLPATCKRRWRDIAASRIKDILKEEATKKKTSSLIQENPEFGDADIARLFWQEKKDGGIPRGVRVPKSYEVAKIRSATEKLAGKFWKTAPFFSAKLPLAKSDRICDVERVKGGLLLRINVDGGSRKSEFFYRVPADDRYCTGKICKPDVLVDDDGKLKLVFAVRHKAPTPYEPECVVPVDVGVLLPFTACAMSEEHRSQVVYPDDEIMGEVRRIERLSEQKRRLLAKAEENARLGRSARLAALSGAQLAEADSLAARVTVIKDRIADLVAHRVVSMAFSLRGKIVLEELSWSVPSHAFFQSLLQENIEALALRSGVPVERVCAAGTSRDCPRCGEALLQGREVSSPVCEPGSRGGMQVPEIVGRGVECPSCGLRGHHDGVSVYNIGRRSLGCGFPAGFVRLRFKSFCWSELPSGWRRAPQHSLRPFGFAFQVSAAGSRSGPG